MFQCKVCGNSYPLTKEYFSKKSSNSTGFKFKCKMCEKNPPYYSNELALKIIDGFVYNNQFYPHDFWSRVLNIKDVVKILIYKEYGKVDFISKFDFYFIDKFKLRYIYSKFKNLYDFINNIFPNKFAPWQLNYVENNFWNYKNNIDWALNWLMDRLFEDKIIVSIDELPQKLNGKIIRNYGLGTMFNKTFSSSPFNLVNYLYPNKFNEWEFTYTPQRFLDKKDNQIKFLKWFINKLLEDGEIKTIDEIPKKMNLRLMKRYGLGNLMLKFNQNPWKAISLIYPDKWQPWEFNSVPNGYWTKKANVKHALDWYIKKLIDNNVITHISELPFAPNIVLLNENGLASLIYRFDCNIDKLFHTFYPDLFNLNSFGLYTSDGIKVQSKEELVIHEWLLNNFNKVYYTGANHKNDNYKWYNPKYNEKYIPDWIVEDKIIIEYFGIYNDKPNQKKSQMVLTYNDKTLKKIDFFSNLKDYFFVPLFREDFKNDIDGLKVKFKNFSTSKIKAVV